MAILTIGLACYDQFYFTTSYPKENSKSFAYDFIESGGGPVQMRLIYWGYGEKIFTT